MKNVILALLCAAALALPFAGTAAAEEKTPRVNMAEIVLKPECRDAFLAAADGLGVGIGIFRPEMSIEELRRSARNFLA